MATTVRSGGVPLSPSPSRTNSLPSRNPPAVGRPRARAEREVVLGVGLFVCAAKASRTTADRPFAACPGARAAGRASPRTRSDRRRPKRPVPPARVRMHVWQRRVPPYVADVREVAEQLAHGGSARPQYGHSKSPYSTTVTHASSGPWMWSDSGSTTNSRSRAALRRPSKASIRRRCDSSPMVRNSSPVTAAAPTGAARMPALASSNCAPSRPEVRARGHPPSVTRRLGRDGTR